MNRTVLTLLLTGLLALPFVGFARDGIEASPYGNVFTDLMDAFHAEGTPCEGATTGMSEVCFKALAVSASYLAERLTEIVDGYEGVGLRSGGWRSANGVWTVALALPNSSYGQLEIYLAEVSDNQVRGVIRLVTNR